MSSDSRFHGIFSALLKEKGVQLEEAPIEEEEVSLEETTVRQPELKQGQIAVDVFEDGGYIVIKSLIAGVKLSDLDIDVADNVVTLRGRREQTDEVPQGGYILQECYYGDFERRIELQHSVNPAKVRATFSKDNVLKVFIPREERKVKIVKINEGG